MFDYVEFQHKNGAKKDKQLKLFALSTCGFCKKAMAFLEENDTAYDYIYVDEIDPELKSKIKSDFLEKFGKKMLFPSLVIDEDDFLVGFIRYHWQKLVSP